jgi:hypothetical protein
MAAVPQARQSEGDDMGRPMTALAIVALSTLAGVAPASAAVPSVSLLAGESFPITVEAHATTTVTLETVTGSKVVCSLQDLKTTYSGGVLNRISKNDSTLDGCKEGANNCKTGTEAAGTIVIKGEGVLVVISESPLTVGYLSLVPATTIACGTTEQPEKLKVKVEGSVLGSYNATLNADITTSKSGFKGTKGKPEKTAYLNEAGETVNASLKANFGLGAEASDLNIAEELSDKASSMMLVSG